MLGFLSRHLSMDEEDDSIPSNLFKSLFRGGSPTADHSVRPSAAKRRHSNKCNARQKNQAANGTKSSPLQSSAKGDIVWAKAFPYTWWPGQVKGFKGSLFLISFFGCKRTRWFDSSEILRFEEAYPRMVKMVGVKLSYEIGLTLDELSRNISMGLKCCYRVSAVDEDSSWAVKRSFNPQEIFRFLLDKAVLPQVVTEEIATVVRVSAALNAFRFGLVVCNTSEVDEGFCAEGVLDHVLDMAVSQCVDDKVVTQLTAFRRFASVKPAWFYQLDWELEEDSLESHKIEVDLELPDCLSEDALYHGRTRDPEVDVSIEPQEKCELPGANHKHEGRDVCVINMVDFSIFDTNEKSDSLIYDRCQVDADEAQLAMPEVDTNETADNVISASSNFECIISSPQNDPNHILKVVEEVTFNRSIAPSLENSTRERNPSIPSQSDSCNSVEVRSSAENLSLRTVPLYRGQLHSLPINKCCLYSPIKILNIKPQSRPEVCFNTSNAAQCIASIPEMAPFAETALQISSNKRKFYEPTTENYKSPQTSLKCSNQNRFLSYPGHFSKPCSRNRQQNRYLESNLKAFYISPLMRDGLNSTNNRSKSLGSNNRRNSSVSVLLNMKFPKDYTLPSKEQLEKKFSVFGPLDHTRTKVFFYTGVGQVVFLHQADAVVAYNYVTKKRIFGQANVRFWFYKYETCRNGSRNFPVAAHSSLNLKPCLKKSCTTEMIDDRKNSRVRFTV